MTMFIGIPFDLPPVIKNNVGALRTLMIENKMAFGCVFGHVMGKGNFIIMAEDAPIEVQRTMLEDLQQTATKMLELLQKVN